MRHYQQIVLAGVTILDLIVKGGFGTEAEPFEDPDRSWLVGNHLGRQFFDPGILREIKNRLGEQVAESTAAEGRVGDDANFTDVARPSVTLTLEYGAADDQCAAQSDHHGLAIEIDFIEPDFDLFAIEQVFLEEGPVFFGDAFEEGAYFGPILRYESANDDGGAIRQLENLRIGSEEMLGDRIFIHWRVPRGQIAQVAVRRKLALILLRAPREACQVG